jgi:hypothetical protein
MDTWKTVKAEALKKYARRYFEDMGIKIEAEYSDLRDSVLRLRNCQVNVDKSIDVSSADKEELVDDELYGVIRDIREYQKLCVKKTGIKLDPGVFLGRIDLDELALRYIRDNDQQALALRFLNDGGRKGDIEKYKRELRDEYAGEAAGPRLSNTTPASRS